MPFATWPPWLGSRSVVSSRWSFGAGDAEEVGADPPP